MGRTDQSITLSSSPFFSFVPLDHWQHDHHQAHRRHSGPSPSSTTTTTDPSDGQPSVGDRGVDGGGTPRSCSVRSIACRTATDVVGDHRLEGGSCSGVNRTVRPLRPLLLFPLGSICVCVSTTLCLLRVLGCSRTGDGSTKTKRTPITPGTHGAAAGRGWPAGAATSRHKVTRRPR